MPANPKFRSMDDLLKTCIAGDEKAIARWTRLSADYAGEDHKLERAEEPA